MSVHSQNSTGAAQCNDFTLMTCIHNFVRFVFNEHCNQIEAHSHFDFFFFFTCVVFCSLCISGHTNHSKLPLHETIENRLFLMGGSYRCALIIIIMQFEKIQEMMGFDHFK